MNSIKEKFDEFISQYPIFEYRVLDTGDIKVQSRVRTICKQECERYGSTWAVLRQWESCQNAKRRSGAIRKQFSFPALRRYRIS